MPNRFILCEVFCRMLFPPSENDLVQIRYPPRLCWKMDTLPNLKSLFAPSSARTPLQSTARRRNGPSLVYSTCFVHCGWFTLRRFCSFSSRFIMTLWTLHVQPIRCVVKLDSVDHFSLCSRTAEPPKLAALMFS